jgi:outer membrane protein assembly factor BamB
LLWRHHEAPAESVALIAARNPQPTRTLGDVGLGAEVTGRSRVARNFLDDDAPPAADESLVVLPIGPQTLAGLDTDTIRVFRVDPDTGDYWVIWNSGVNPELGFVWAKARGEGVLVPLGLPRDPVLRDALHRFSRRRRFADLDDDDAVRELFEAELAPFLSGDEEELTEIRTRAADREWGARPGGLRPDEMRVGSGGHPDPMPLPGDVTHDEFRARLRAVTVTAQGLPEEVLFDPPDLPVAGAAEQVDRNWWMYQGDVEHSGVARGSAITSTTVGRLKLRQKVPVLSAVCTIPAIVDSKVYVGSLRTTKTSPGGVLYKIDLRTGVIDAQFEPPQRPAKYPQVGIGGTPAIVDGRVFISTVYGQVYCLDAADLSVVWMQDLKTADALRRQPINNPDGDCWPSPLVVDGRVYVASGEGESLLPFGPFGFVWCLDAATGLVVWVFCTSKFVDPDEPGGENRANVIPRSAAISDPLPAWAMAAGFSLHDDPPHMGAAPWSSCAYDRGLNRIYIGTGNSRPDDPLPDARYASGVIALDATNGEFRGFHQPLPSDNYRPNDLDVDVPCPPTLFDRDDGKRVVAYGSKGGSFFLLDAATMEVLPGGRRQLLPRDEVTGGRIHTVDPKLGGDIAQQDQWRGENSSGVFASAAVDRDGRRLFVGVGGYRGNRGLEACPFVRALSWDDLSDAWPTKVEQVTTGGLVYTVRRYANATPPLYTSREAGLGSPAVVNDVVLVPSSLVGLYAMDSDTGLCLWTAPGLPVGGFLGFCMGPAVYGDYVVAGAGDGVYIYRLDPPTPDRTLAVAAPPVAPPPAPSPDLLAAVREVVRQELAARDVVDRASEVHGG